MERCGSHDLMQNFFQQTVDRLSGELKALTSALTQQSRSNGEAIAKVLENQAVRRELCGQQGARLDNHDKLLEALTKRQIDTEAEIWEAINKLREANTELKVRMYRYIGLGTGIGLTVSFLGQLIIQKLL